MFLALMFCAIWGAPVCCWGAQKSEDFKKARWENMIELVKKDLAKVYQNIDHDQELLTAVQDATDSLRRTNAIRERYLGSRGFCTLEMFDPSISVAKHFGEVFPRNATNNFVYEFVRSVYLTQRMHQRPDPISLDHVRFSIRYKHPLGWKVTYFPRYLIQVESGGFGWTGGVSVSPNGYILQGYDGIYGPAK